MKVHFKRRQAPSLLPFWLNTLRKELGIFVELTGNIWSRAGIWSALISDPA
jgi:hypothetical protein